VALDEPVVARPLDHVAVDRGGHDVVLHRYSVVPRYARGVLEESGVLYAVDRGGEGSGRGAEGERTGQGERQLEGEGEREREREREGEALPSYRSRLGTSRTQWRRALARSSP
jgi:hypothetical protein